MTLAEGSSVVDTITLTRQPGFTGSATLAAVGLPTGVTAAFGTNPASSTSVLTLTASSAAPPGSYLVIVTGVSGVDTVTTSIGLTVTAAGSFTLAPSSSTLSVTQGKTATDTITVTDVAPFAGSVTLSTSTLPVGVTAQYGTNPTTSTSVLTFTAGSAAAVGTFPVTITAISGALTATTTISLTVAPSVAGACTVDYTIAWQSSNAFGAGIVINNTAAVALTSWTLTWAFADGQTIAQIWNDGTQAQSGSNVTVTSASYNGSIPPGSSYSGLGFNGAWNGIANAIPTAISLNGVACTVN